ncbi:MAG: hypothetical protein ACM687_15760 [Bacteroidales bacterium]
MKRNIREQADIRLRLFCRRLTGAQRRLVLWVMFIPFAVCCVLTAVLPFVKEEGPSGNAGEMFTGDSVRLEFVQSIVKDAERKNQKDAGTAAKAVQASGLKREETAE